MQCLLVSPRLVVQKGDFLGSGVPYWPVELATFASFLRDSKKEIDVLDLFGLAPTSLEEKTDHYLQGLNFESALKAGNIRKPDLIFVFGISFMSHPEIQNLIRQLKKRFPKTPVSVLENSQAVTAYAVDHCCDSLFDSGADFLICGEPYWNWPDIEASLLKLSPPPDNVLSPSLKRPPQRIFKKEMSLPRPAWDLFPIRNYWKIPYSHGPKTKTFLPMLTSRGCPWHCDFCVIPETNSLRWRSRSAQEVVSEMLYFKDTLGIHDFQLEDLNPTVFWPRIEEICKTLIEKKADIRFYMVSGTKAETIPIEGIELLAKAGCRYISISPESGSPELMKKIGKRFDYDHANELVAICKKNGISTQTCFLVGHPEESETDFNMTVSALKRLVRSGATEVAIFIVSPFAGSSLFQSKAIKMVSKTDAVTFSPKGRDDFSIVSFRRDQLIRVFFIEKLKKGPELWIQGLRAIFGTPKTKMENLPRRILFLQKLFLKNKFRKIFLSQKGSYEGN